MPPQAACNPARTEPDGARDDACRAQGTGASIQVIRACVDILGCRRGVM